MEKYDARVGGKTLKLSIDRISSLNSAINRVRWDKELEEPEWFTDEIVTEVKETFNKAKEIHRDRTRDNFTGVYDDRVDEVIVSEEVYEFLEKMFPFLVTGTADGSWKLRDGNEKEDLYNKYYHRFNSALVDTEFQDVDDL